MLWPRLNAIRLRLDALRAGNVRAPSLVDRALAMLGGDKALPPLELVRVQGRMSASETFPAGANGGRPAFGTFGHTVTLTDFSLLTTGGLALAPTTIVEAYVPAKGSKPTRSASASKNVVAKN